MPENRKKFKLNIYILFINGFALLGKLRNLRVVSIEGQNDQSLRDKKNRNEFVSICIHLVFMNHTKYKQLRESIKRRAYMMCLIGGDKLDINVLLFAIRQSQLQRKC